MGLMLGVVLTVVLAGAGLVWLGVGLVRWARRNREAAAELALGVYAPAAARGGGWLSSGTWEDFRGWLGDRIDGVEPSGAADGGSACDGGSGDGGCDGGD
jgi:hypothetical protein